MVDVKDLGSPDHEARRQDSHGSVADGDINRRCLKPRKTDFHIPFLFRQRNPPPFLCQLVHPLLDFLQIGKSQGTPVFLSQKAHIAYIVISTASDGSDIDSHLKPD